MQAPADVRPLLQAVEAEMEAQGYPDQDRFAVRLALDEAISNAIKHGHRGDPRKWVQVIYRVTTDRVLAAIVDDGPGFDPQQVRDPLADENLDRPSGRGLLLMRRYTTWMTFNTRGNGVVLCRCRSHASPPPPAAKGSVPRDRTPTS